MGFAASSSSDRAAMRGFLCLVALALAHVARSEVIVSNFGALQNAIKPSIYLQAKLDRSPWEGDEALYELTRMGLAYHRSHQSILRHRHCSRA